MLDEAWSAFGLDAPIRHHSVNTDFDSPIIPLPVGDGTVGVPSPARAAR
jgi:hypothetical protein